MVRVHTILSRTVTAIFILWGGWQVSGVAFDSYWSSPNSDGSGETVMYRFGSVGQVSYQLVLNDYQLQIIMIFPTRQNHIISFFLVSNIYVGQVVTG